VSGMPDVLSNLPDVQVLYIVTAVVLAALVLWAGVVLVFAPTAPDDSGSQPDDKPPGKDTPKPDPKPGARPPVLDETPPPVDVSPNVSPAPPKATPPSLAPGPAKRAIAGAGGGAPVVILPVMRRTLDSHTEIKDGGPEVVVLEPTDAGPGPVLSLVSALARSEIPLETSVIVDAHRLFIVADGSARRVQQQLASALVVDALVAAFSVDTDDVFPTDASLAPRADRLRRSVLVAQATIKGRTDSEPDIVTAPMRLLAAHFAPDNRRLHLASLGPIRAYRLRGGELVRMNKPAVLKGDALPELDLVVSDTAADDVYVFGTEAAFVAIEDELQAVLAEDSSIARIAAHLVDAATRQGVTGGLSAIVVRVQAG
jgi:hypothetical protein